MAGLLLLLPVRGETPKCSNTRVCKWRTVWPKFVAEKQRHVKEYTTQDLKALGILSLKVKSWDKRKVGRKKLFIFLCFPLCMSLLWRCLKLKTKRY
jgi:hypothetical protein